MSKWTPRNVAIAAAVGVVGIWWLKRSAAQTVRQVGQAVNPLNNDNVFSRYFEDGYRQLSGSNGSIGGDFYDWMHDDERWWN